MTWIQFNQVLATKNRKSRDHGGAPDCFFLCVKNTIQLARDLTVHQIRALIADFVVMHPPQNIRQVVEIIFDTQPEFRGSCNVTDDMSTDDLLLSYVGWLRHNLFAGDVELNAVCQIFNVRVKIFSFDDETHSVSVQEHGQPADGDQQVIELCFFGSHYRECAPFEPANPAYRIDRIVSLWSSISLLTSSGHSISFIISSLANGTPWRTICFGFLKIEINVLAWNVAMIHLMRICLPFVGLKVAAMVCVGNARMVADAFARIAENAFTTFVTTIGLQIVMKS